MASILVIEDDDKWGGVFERNLTRWGYAYTRAETADDARAFLQACRFDLILLDLCLDHSDMTLETDELLADIGRNHAGVPIIAVTAKNVSGNKLFGLQGQGVTGYVSKLDGTMTELKGKIREAIASRPVVENAPTDTTAILVRPPQNNAIEAVRRKPIKDDEANIAVRNHLDSHPHATARELAKVVGIAVGRISSLPGWRAAMRRRKAAAGLASSEA